MGTQRLTYSQILVGLAALLALTLAAPLTGWAAEEADAAGAKKATPQEGMPPEGRGEGFQPEPKGEECPATFGPIITDTAIPIDKGKFAFQPTFGVGFVTRTFSPNWRRVSAGGNFYSFSMDYRFTYGLWDNLEVFVVVPFLFNWANGVDTPGPGGERSANFGGINDVNLTFKYRLVEETATRPTVTVLFATDFPTGHFRHLNPGRLGTDKIGGGAFAFTTGLNLSKYVRPFVFYGNFWYSMQTDFTNDDGRQHPRDYVTVNLAAEYPIVPKWVALLELTSSWDGGRLFGTKSNVPPAALLSLLPGIEYMATDKFSLALGVNVDLIGKNNNAVVTPLLSMVYAF